MNPLDKVNSFSSNSFPFHVFGEETAASMKRCAKEKNIPVDFMGVTALFTLAGLSGAMYVGEANGGIKTMIYGMIIAPSGVGKSLPYKLLCGNIISEPYRVQKEKYDEEMSVWKINERIARKKDEPFTVAKPILATRMIQGGTPEGFLKKAAESSCGFGVYYDEGGDMQTINKYNKAGDAGSFWNKLWNGDPYLDVKVDEERERYVHNPAISLLVGIQTEKVGDLISPEEIRSGLSSRMLMVESGIIHLEYQDFFGPKLEMNKEWQECIRGLLGRGLCNYGKDSKPTVVQFNHEAKNEFNRISRLLIDESNQRRVFISKELNENEIMNSYAAKLNAYFGRFCLLLAIHDNFTGPTITKKHVQNAHELYKYFFSSAKNVLMRLSNQHETGLTPKQSEVLNNLPVKFALSEARAICEKIGFSSRLFEVSFTRGAFKNYIRKLNDGLYEKM